ncbi:hypothetical protein HBH56_212220 [Parastagonospora nodorum]|nr:hypothetical protein HBH56_212220 [Parastagonospora nodorum]KAH3931607.1 hypothetical protein HBH54_100830 [Parastagonospora nodorum]KAH3944282.1 hypothetical protein HBH53_162300 [Parastagonospora nodorum]KAH3960788.1 hypothetical protein HBH51_190510 [Parastagonospora nodorum]KAH3962892.1 hypothetical protein HBH52_223170 [Parastagonospora nodorum]
MRMLVRQLIAALTSRRVLRTSSNTTPYLTVQQIYQRGASQAQRGAKQNKVFSFIRSLSKATTTGAVISTTPLLQHRISGPRIGDIQGEDCVSGAQSGLHVHNFIHWCVPRPRYATHLQLTLPRAKFCLYHRQLIDIQRTNDILPESQKHEYEYSPVPADTVLLPISPNLMMHFFLHLDEAALRSVPL